MSRPQPRTSFVPTPSQNPGSVTQGPMKVQREAPPFVVPASLVVDDRDKLEPHWLPTIDAATD